MDAKKSSGNSGETLQRVQQLDELIDDKMHDVVYAAYRGWTKKTATHLKIIRSGIEAEINRWENRA